LVVIVVGACGDDDNGGSAPATTAATAIGSTTEGTPSLTLVVEGISGSQGQLVVAVLSSTSGAGPVESVCLGVDRDPFSGTGVFSTFDPNNPCGKDSPYGEVISEDGEYSVTVGVVTPGETMPSLCVDVAATIAGPSELKITGADMSSDCGGF
jgi:hypothetical protein